MSDNTKQPRPSDTRHFPTDMMGEYRNRTPASVPGAPEPTPTTGNQSPSIPQ